MDKKILHFSYLSINYAQPYCEILDDKAICTPDLRLVTCNDCIKKILAYNGEHV